LYTISHYGAEAWRTLLCLTFKRKKRLEKSAEERFVEMAKILVAGDNSSELRVIMDVFKETNHEIVTAGDGETAERKARTENIDMIIMDTLLPKKNGFQVCRELRADKKMAEVPIIMVNSADQNTDKDWGLKQGATEYLIKPFTPLDLLLSVKKHIKKK
jgi:DNA-binding response OmpR family regulator